jgi:hypothetical protein
MINARLRELVAQVIHLLVHKEYEQLFKLTNGVRLSTQEITQAIEDYGRILIEPPDQAFDFMDIIQVQSDLDMCWSITMPVWTQEEGRSDLSVELTVTDNGNHFTIELDDLHVL